MRLLIVILALVWLEAAALASPEPIMAPAGEWVEPVTLPAPNPALRDRPFQALLVSSQSLYGADHHDHHAELAFLIQNMQGLQSLGNIILPWQPDQSDLIIHKVHILRGGAVIDLLANGHGFTVLRRENNLESAMLDGVLTAVMQAEGLMIGDVLNIAFTTRRRAGALPLRGENFFAAAYGAPVRRFHVRQIWSADRPMRWRGTGVLERARVREVPLGTELVLDLADAEGPQPPANAPPRFALPATLQITQYRDWAEISAVLAPLYDRAQELAPASALRAQIERIGEASQDPRERAMAALRLVQDEIRYFALGMGDGNYVPASADQTWTRRYGDCKGKTATLLALLRGLGIDAEPVLVHMAIGDSLAERLPQMALFDHVVVRARIGGRSYWLDGTRTGDRNLDDLASSALGWGLPLRAGGADLERLTYAPPSLPLTEDNIVYDGSGGFDAPVPIRIERLFRGDFATSMRAAVSQLGRDEFLRRMREADSDLPGNGEEIHSVDLRDDEASGTIALILAGRTRMDWRTEPGTGSPRFRFDNATISWTVDFDRPAGPYRDVPFAFPIPAYIVATETVILPNQGRGFAIDGTSFERVVAGTRIGRRLSLTGNRATARSVFQRIEREVAAREARASVDAIRAIEDDEAFLRAPAGTAIGAATGRTGGVGEPGSASGLVQSGFEKMGRGEVRAALADFDRAIELAPDWARAHANRGVALVHLDRLDEAEAALAIAMRRDQQDFVVHQGYGFLHLQRDHPEEALRSLTRSLELDADNSFTLGLRADAYQRLGQLERTLADLARMGELSPGSAHALMARARLLGHLGRPDEALAAADAAMASEPHNLGLPIARGEVLEQVGRAAEARDAYQAALRQLEAWLATAPSDEASQYLSTHVLLLVRNGRTGDAVARVDAQLRRFAGNTRMLALRCRVRAEANAELQRALADCNEALEAEPGHDEAMSARALVHARAGRWAEAVRDYSALLANNPRNAEALYGRGLARQRAQDMEGGARDMAAGLRYLFSIGSDYERRGLRPVPAEPTAAVTN